MECVFRWESDRIPVEKIAEMRVELMEHLLDAVRGGRPVEAVVGNNIGAFADEWGALPTARPTGGTGNWQRPPRIRSRACH